VLADRLNCPLLRLFFAIIAGIGRRCFLVEIDLFGKFRKERGNSKWQ
jgi:hypothetical protein